MASHGSGGDSDSYSDGPESGYRDAFVSEVFVGDANQGEGGRPTPTIAATTPGAPTEGTARGERGADAPPGDASQPDLTTPEGRGAVRDVLGQAMASTSYTGGGQGQGPLGYGGDAQVSGTGHQGGTAPGQQGVPVPDPQGSQGAELRTQGYGGGHHLPGQGGGLPDQGQGGHQGSGGGQPAPSLGQPQQVPPRQTGEQAWRAYREQGMHASQAPIVSSGVQVKTEQLQPLGQSSLASGQGQGQPTQSGQGQQGLGGYGPQLSDPYQGQPYGLSSQSIQQTNPFAAGATSTPAPTTLYNSPYGGPANGVTTSAAPSVKMPQTAIASYGGISVANMQRAGFGFANPFSQPAGQAPPVLPAPQQPAWAGPTQPSPQTQAWQGQMAT
ncbi:hypothetical protein PR002_g13442 [Phytophthora rubi]|uniref:Uncharacterized protein n=1 Tax=Phytophthora rubi TaxID=129364 RepID=A0A6A3LM97_9STRA|nr:hypothetical protein PR002_g13442 [Phytophthora rubi]